MSQPPFWLDEFPSPTRIPRRVIPPPPKMTAPGRFGFLAVWAVFILACLAFWWGVVVAFRWSMGW
jgi:hypothetical protein